MTKEALDILKADAASKYDEYLQAEEKLWSVKNAFEDIALYKVFKKAKSAFHAANQKWEIALLHSIEDDRNKN